MKVTIIVLSILTAFFINSCCKGYPYIGNVKLMNTKKDSINYINIYYYDNEPTFLKPVDSNLNVSSYQNKENLDLMFGPGYDKFAKQFKYVIFYRTKMEEYKVKVIEDYGTASSSCGSGEHYPKIIEINGIRRVNNNNSIVLN